MAVISYAEKLTDPRWQRRRLEILQRDEFKCTLCNDDKITLHIHHKEYKRGKEPWEYENDQLTTLCKHCHKVVEDLKKENHSYPFVAVKYQNGDYTTLTVGFMHSERGFISGVYSIENSSQRLTLVCFASKELSNALNKIFGNGQKVC